MGADIILFNGKVHSGDKTTAGATAIAVKDGKFLAVGSDSTVMFLRSEGTRLIDLKKRLVIPGINDSHIHMIRGGLNYNLELRWDGVPSLADALRMLRQQVDRTPSPQWVRVVGGWSEFQFAERRMPTLEEINALAPDTPVFILHLYDRAMLNRAALRAVGYTRDTPAPPGGQITKDARGEPTGLMIASPNAMILYATLAKGPKLGYAHQVNSTRHFMRELNRFGITSAIDAGGGFQNFPEDYQVIDDLHREGLLTVRVAYNLFTQRPKQEWEDFSNWTKTVKLYQGDEMYRHNGAGEMLVFSAADFEDFVQPRPELPANMEDELERVVRLLVGHRWPFRLHATYNESITRFLNVFERVNRDMPFSAQRWMFDHCEAIDERNIERVKALGGGIAIQGRMAYQGEYFTQRYGVNAGAYAPPVRKMLEAGVPVGGGSDATRVSSYNPWVAMYWLVSGKTLGGLQLYTDNRLERETALGLFTAGSAWFSNEQDVKGAIKTGMLADLAVLDRDYFQVAVEEIRQIEAELTMVGGKIVYGKGDYASLAPPPIEVLPDWSPVRHYNGYFRAASSPDVSASCTAGCQVHGHHYAAMWHAPVAPDGLSSFWGALGCSCFAF